MKSVNLFDIGKAFYTRSHRDPNHNGKAKARLLADELWQTTKTKDELLEIISQLKTIERALPRIREFYADIAERAVQSGNYTVDIPNEIAHRFNDRPGRVYILTASSRPDQCKLGATTMHIASRCIAYEAKYGYCVRDVFSLETRTPFTLEKQIADRISHLRVSGNAKGDSIEWYRITPNALKNLIIQMHLDLSTGRQVKMNGDI